MKHIFAACLIIACHAFALAQNVLDSAKAEAENVNNELIACVKSGDVDCVVRTLAAGANPNATNDDGVAALITAAESESPSIVKALISAGADVNKSRKNEASALCRATLFGRKENVKLLIVEGAKINVVCDADHGGSPLMDALSMLSLDAFPEQIKNLVQTSDEYKSQDEKQRLQAMWSQPTENYLAIARLLVKRGADVNVVAKCDVGETALMYAAMSANVEMVKELLARGADPNIGGTGFALSQQFENEYAKTVLSKLPAISKSQIALLSWSEKTKAARAEIKELLIKAGAKKIDFESESENAKSEAERLEEVADEVFSEAIESGDIEDLKRLVDAYLTHPLGAKALPQALRLAVIYGRTELLEIMLERGVNPNIGTVKGRTPLMEAASNGNVEYVKMLLAANADVNLKDDDGGTALDDAERWMSSRKENYQPIVEALKARGAKSKRNK